MRLPRAKFTLRSLMAMMAVVAVVLLLIKRTQPPAGPRYRMVEVFHRNPNGSIKAIEMERYNLDAPVDQFHGMPDGETRYRDSIARLKAIKAEYKVTKPRGFQPNGQPIP